MFKLALTVIFGFVNDYGLTNNLQVDKNFKIQRITSTAESNSQTLSRTLLLKSLHHISLKSNSETFETC
jgi:hypothetical protein